MGNWVIGEMRGGSEGDASCGGGGDLAKDRGVIDTGSCKGRLAINALRSESTPSDSLLALSRPLTLARIPRHAGLSRLGGVREREKDDL